MTVEKLIEKLKNFDELAEINLFNVDNDEWEEIEDIKFLSAFDVLISIRSINDEE